METAKRTNIRALDEREASVLTALVYEFIASGKPVGSRTFVQKYSFSISPATMRNIMSDLESLGFLMQPHTSSGRIPTDSGFRFYVDNLLDSYNFNKNENIEVNDDIFKRELQLEKVFSSITRFLSAKSSCAGVMLAPRMNFTVLKRVELVPLDMGDILVVMITRTGMVINRKVTISTNVIQDSLYEYSKYLTSELSGYSLEEIRETVIKRLRNETGSGEGKKIALDIVELSISGTEEPVVFADGFENLLRIPEMVEEDRLKSLLSIIEDKGVLKEILEKSMDSDGVTTAIGNEIEDERIKGCSMVSAAYKIGNSRVGALGVFGPTRMDYEKVVPLVDYTGKVISDFLTKMSK